VNPVELLSKPWLKSLSQVGDKITVAIKILKHSPLPSVGDPPPVRWVFGVIAPGLDTDRGDPVTQPDQTTFNAVGQRGTLWRVPVMRAFGCVVLRLAHAAILSALSSAEATHWSML